MGCAPSVPEVDAEAGENVSGVSKMLALKKMYDEGLITRAEFDAKKAEILEKRRRKKSVSISLLTSVAEGEFR